MNIRPAIIASVMLGSIFFGPSVLASDWTVRNEESHLGFVGTQSDASFEGEFQSFEAEIVFDAAHLEASSVTVQVDIASFHWMDADRHRVAMSADWFGVEGHATAIFQSTNFRYVDGNSYEAEGTLTLKGITLPYTLPFELQIEGETAYMTSFSQILRHDFSVGTGEVDAWFGNQVDLSISLVADRN